MKLSLASIAVLGVTGTSAFTTAPRTFVPRTNGALSMAEGKVPFFAASSAAKKEEAAPAAAEEEEAVAAMTLEEEVEMLTQAELKKLKTVSNLRNTNGVEYAPWMNISKDDESEIKKIVKAKAEVRRRRQMEEQSVRGALLVDSVAQELSGNGLRAKVVNGAVELDFATSSEANTKGFIIKRRAARTEEFETLVSFEDWGPLASKGPDGGEYRYLDDTVSPGGWVYRITECEVNGNTNDICQTLIDVETDEEQRGAVIAAAAIGVLGVAAVAAGMFLDPVGGY